MLLLQISFPRVSIDLSISRQDQHLVYAEEPHHCGSDAVTESADEGDPCEIRIPFRKPPGKDINDQETEWKSDCGNL